MDDDAKFTAPAGDLIVGGENIARWLYGNADSQAMSDVYRNPMGLTFFSHGGRKAAFKSTLRRELSEVENRARKASEAGKAA
jgi:hypothetical protein